MQWIDWILFSIPIAIVVIAAIKAQRYVHGVADFLSAGRIANRYVLRSTTAAWKVMSRSQTRPKSTVWKIPEINHKP